ncbi:MAG: DUF1801 domain-containing protein [Saprospiraceae bacterium]|nr:DUF1801 domain-containing protein [Saprospiraceae bacterium]
MAELKTKQNDASVEAFLESVEHKTRKADAYTVLEMMKEVTGEEPSMWGDSIIGFGNYHYVYDSGREGDWFLMGFSPRKTSLTLYMMNSYARFEEILSRLGKYKTGKSCLYITNLKNVDLNVLRELMEASLRYLQDKYSSNK